MTMDDFEIPLGVCRCKTVKHALTPTTQARTRELIRMAEAQDKQDLVKFYSERLTRCTTAYNHERVA